MAPMPARGGRSVVAGALLAGLAAAQVGPDRPLLTLTQGQYDGLSQIDILSPIPLTGGWIGGHTMRIGAEMAMDIINSQQRIIPGYRISTDWFDDKCNPDYGPPLMLDKWNAGNYAALGANGCSAVCRATALISPSIRIPHLSYGCASGVLADSAAFPGFARFMTDESAMSLVFQALGRRFNWTKIVIITGEAARFDAPAASVMEFFRNDPIETEWLTPRNPNWEDLLVLMQDVKRSFQRVIVVLSYEPFYRKVVCAAIVAGIPKGVVWLSVGWHKVGWWTEEDPDLLALEPRCTAAAITEMYNGGIGPAGSGAPLPSQMNDPLDCLDGYTSQSFRDAFMPLATQDGYPTGQNILPGAPYSEIVPYGADGICAWAYTFKHMFDLGHSLSDLIRPTQAVYEEMVRYIKNDLDFWGVSGRVFWNGGNNKPGTLAVNQAQNGDWKLVSMLDLSNTLVEQAGETMFWGDGSTAPPSSFAPCPVGTLRDSAGVCQPCRAGHYFYELLGECVPCELGEFNPNEGSIGQVSCRKCADGTVATAKGSPTCTPCPPGTFSNGKEGNGAFCVPCPLGQQQENPGAAECKRCQIGRYQDQVGQLQCEQCQDGRTTRFFSASSIYECVCPAGQYEPWPVNPLRPYMCEGCPEGMQCPEGARLGDWFNAGNVSSPKVYPVLKVQYFAEPDKPVYVYKCLDERNCPGGNPGKCADRREGIACGRCEKKFYGFGGECNECNALELTTVLFPVLPIMLGPPIVAFIYTRLLEPLNIRYVDGPKNRALALGFFFLVHFQTLGIINQFNLVLPPMVKVPWEGLGMINTGIQFLRPECAGGGAVSSFAAQFALRSALPLFMGAFFILDYFLFNKVIIRFTSRLNRGENSIWTIGMKEECTINAFGTVMYTFSIAVLAIAFDLFKCFPHPNGLASLRVSPDIMCYESDWNGMLIIGILAILIYFVFSFSLFTWVLKVAPIRFSDPVFRRRWKFLLVKWRANRWWFGQAFLLKGVSLNLTLVMFKAGALQVLWTALTLMGYIVLVMIFKPWRHTACNIMDSVVSLALLSISLVSVYYSGRSDEADNTLDKVLAILTFLPLPIVAAAIAMLVYTWRKRPHIELEDGLLRTHAIERLIVQVSNQGPLSLLHALLNTTSSDRQMILNSLQMLLAESTAVQVPGARRLLQRIAVAKDGTLNLGLDQNSAYCHNMLLNHFKNRASKGIPVAEQAEQLFGAVAFVHSADFERRFLEQVKLSTGGDIHAKDTQATMSLLTKYAAVAMDCYGEGGVSKVNFVRFADAMGVEDMQSLAGMSFEVEA